MNDPNEKIAVIILAAGLGTRMKSNKAKVLHTILGRPMILYVIDAAHQIAGENITVVVGHQADKVKETVLDHFEVQFALQKEQLGTGHAVLSAVPNLPEGTEHVLILCGDVPMISPDSLNMVVQEHILKKRAITVMAVHIDNPTGYGRVVVDDNNDLIAIVEEADANAQQKRIKSINTGIYCIDNTYLRGLLEDIKAENAQGEYYLTDIIQLGRQQNLNMGTVVGPDANEVIGINQVEQLELVEEMIKAKKS